LSNNPEQVITLNGFSKAYAMTGWRLGYVVASKQIISELVKVQQTAVSCPTAFAQKGAVEALRGPQDSLTKMKEEFECRRNIIIDGLNGISGLSVTRPKGAFYAFVDMRSAGKPSLELAELLLNEAKIVTTPGSAFGAHGEGYLRVSYATSIENINTGIEGIRRVLQKM
jgi:aspartate/methionine/tyrosine aminotransferase